MYLVYNVTRKCFVCDSGKREKKMEKHVYTNTFNDSMPLPSLCHSSALSFPPGTEIDVRFQVLTAASMKLRIF
jgi:hypothetical protein